MEAQELSTDEGELVAAGVTTTGSSVDWQPTGDDLGLQVVARRPGPPPTYRSAHLEWYVDLTGPDGRAAHYYVSYQPEHPTLALEAAHPGVVVSADGTEARFDRPGAAEADQITIWRDGLTISSGSGPMFVNTTDPAPASAPYEVLTAIVDSLTPVPADDPRLTEHALDEDTVTHP
jgi:hypothetical protein